MNRRFFLPLAVFALSLLGAGALAAVCEEDVPVEVTSRAHEPLYFAVEMTRDGHAVGSPKMVGFEGKSVAVEKRQPGAEEAEYRLVLRPRESGDGYKVVLELSLPSGKKLGEIALLHGEERVVELGERTELKVLLMRVDSPEFRALMRLGSAPGASAI